MLTINGASGTLVSPSSTGGQSSTLSDNLSFAANSNRLQSTGITAGPVPISSKQAYAALGNEALSCFRNKDLASFIEGSASKGDDSAKAILKMAVTLHLLRSSIEVRANDLQGPQDALEALAARFKERPALSVMTRDASHPSRYDEYQRLKKSVDTLLSKVDTAKVFETVQLGLAQKFVVDGLRGGAEHSWGQLDANSAKNVMANGNWSAAAGKALESQLKLAKAGGNSGALAELISQTLKALDLSRPGREVAPEKPGNEPPKISDHLRCCHGCGNGGVTQNANPVINVYPPGYTGVGGLDNLTDVVKQAVADRLGNFQIASPSEATKTTQTVSVQTDDRGLSDGGRDLSTAGSSGVHSYDEGLSLGDDDLLSDAGADVREAGGNSSTYPSLATFNSSGDEGERTVSVDTDLNDDSTPGSRLQPLATAVSARNPSSESLENSSGSGITAPASHPVGVTLARNNLPDAYVDHMGITAVRRNELFNESLASVVQLGVHAKPVFAEFKNLIKEGAALNKLKEHAVYPVLEKMSPAAIKKLAELIQARDRVESLVGGVDSEGRSSTPTDLDAAVGRGIKVNVRNLPGTIAPSFNRVDVAANRATFYGRVASAFDVQPGAHSDIAAFKRDLADGKNALDTPVGVAVRKQFPGPASIIDRLIRAYERSLTIQNLPMTPNPTFISGIEGRTAIRDNPRYRVNVGS